MIYGFGARLPKSFTSTSIVLIPKIPNPSSFTNFRPIGFYNFVHKIITKVMALRLGSILSSIISEN